MVTWLHGWLWLFAWITASCSADIYQASCRGGLGMQSGSIHDSAISASSSYDESSVGPQNGRIRTERNGGAWCPRNQIARNVYEWMQIDMGEVKKITLIETQGRFGNGQGQEYAEAYRLEYQRVDNTDRWIRYHDRKGQEVFDGNDNTYLEEQRMINPPIIARRIRIIPYSLHPRTICMRVELYGCKWKEGLLSYSMPQGERRGAEVDLFDFTYDGVVTDTYLTGGLGQLVDGDEGLANFRLDPTGIGNKGYEWVGWKNESMTTPPVDIIFEFSVVRNFSQLRLHCNNMFSKDVRVFKTGKLYFSVGGRFFQSAAVKFDYMRDTLIEFARPVMIPIPHRIGKFVKVQLFFDDRWMMLSEMHFESVPAHGNYSDEVVGDTTPVFPDDDGSGRPRLVQVDVPAPRPSTTSEPPLDPHASDDQYIGIIVGALAALLVLAAAVFLFVFLRHRKHKYNQAGEEKQVEHHVTLNLNDLRAMANAEMGYNTDTVTSREYAVPDVTKSALIGNGFQPYHDDSPPPPLPPHPRALASADQLHMQGFSGNSLYAVPNNMDLMWKESLSVLEFPRTSLQFVEKLGEGQFGEVHLCETARLAEVLGDDFLLNRQMNGGHAAAMVAVKILRHDADQQARNDFHKEVKIMSKLKDPNIVKVLGVCQQEEPLCMIVEYMKYGDLNQFLQQHVPAESTVARNPHVKCLTYGCLIYMATQIASGMKYLETLNMVHRDLATRNCLVGNNCTIKISDFGMSRSLYSSDYYRIEGKAMLPIRWMAWESVLLGKFSTKSDVWSFAVTLWETLLLARDQPYDSLNDEQVIENCGHYYRNDGRQLILPQPANCPKEIYDLMVECWNRDELYRPAFREIHMFLQRKNMGYNPQDERIMVPFV